MNYSLAEAMTYIKDEDRRMQYLTLADQSAQRLIVEADTNKVARRPARIAETTDITAARNEQTSGL